MCANRNQREVPEYFYRPPHGRTLNWYVRLVPPIPLRGLPGQKEFRKSTGTSDLRKAKAIGARLIAEKRAEWDQVLSQLKQPKSFGPRILSSEIIEHVCARRLYHWMKLDDDGRFVGQGYDDKSREALSHLCKVTDKTMRSVLARGRSASEWHETLGVIDYWCEQIGEPVERKDPLYPQLVRQFAAVELEAVSRLIRRNQGEPEETPPEPHPVSATLSAMLEPYRDYKRKMAGSKHVNTSVSIWSRLIEHLGDVPLGSVKPSDLFGFLEARMRASDSPWSMETAHGRAKSTLREIFSLARTQGLFNSTNPVDDLSVLPMLSAQEEKSRKKPRLPFEDEQLNRLFCSEWYLPDSGRWTGKMRTDLGARYWVPLLCLCHGNRVREVLQLLASDIGKQGIPPVLHFRAEIDGEQDELAASGAKRSVKNDATTRIVPVHPILCKLGFLEFVHQREQADGVNAFLFPSSLPKPGGRSPILGRAYEQAFVRYVRDTLGFGHGYANHSFRHMLEDRIRDAQRPGQQWPAGLALAYMGRKRVRAQDARIIEAEGSQVDYGRGYSPATMLEYIKLLDFDAIKLPIAFSEWLASAKS